MTKNEVVETIKNEIWMNGFQPEMDEKYSPLPFIKGDDDLYIAVRIHARPDFENSDYENRVEAYTVEVQSSIRRMGGSPTTDELLEAADQIRRGAELTRNLQEMRLSYTVRI